MTADGCRQCIAAHVHTVSLYWPGDVLNFLRADVLEGEAQLVQDLIAHYSADANPAGLSQRLQARRDIDTIAEDVIAVDDDVADIDADTKIDSFFLRNSGVAFGHTALHVDRTTHRVDHAGELQQETIARGLDDPAPMFGYLGINQVLAVGLQSRQRGAVVTAHEQ